MRTNFDFSVLGRVKTGDRLKVCFYSTSTDHMFIIQGFFKDEVLDADPLTKRHVGEIDHTQSWGNNPVNQEKDPEEWIKKDQENRTLTFRAGRDWDLSTFSFFMASAVFWVEPTSPNRPH